MPTMAAASFVTLVLVLVPGVAAAETLSPASQNKLEFVTLSSDGTLVIGSESFRFAGANIYWLGLDENVPPHTVAYPTAFRIRDALETAAGMGARVVRCHTCGISMGNPLSFEPTLNSFNQTAMRSVDFAVAQARALGIRLIVPLVDNWRYYHGGKHIFTSWRGIVDEMRFFTDAQVIADFKNYVQHVLEHVNSVTGVALKDDPTIMAWETGNEIKPPTAWTKDIAGWIKTKAPHQLVLDGTNGINREALAIADVDMYSQHFYPVNSDLVKADAALTRAAGKAYIAGEFGWGAGNVSGFLETVQRHAGVAGDLYWSLFPHADDHGFVPHGDKHTLHWPGDTPAMAAAATLLTSHAWAMAGSPTPKGAPVRSAPSITLANASGVVAWRGTAMAALYDVRRAPAQEGPWTTFCSACASDDDTPIQDPKPPPPTQPAWYSVRGISNDGRPGPWSEPAQRRT